MQVLLQIIFWGSMLLLLHTYVLYPMLMQWLARGREANAIRYSRDATDLPRVSVLMSVYNEEAVIEAKLDNLRRLNYPQEKLHIYIGSDCSDDATAAIIERVIPAFDRGRLPISSV